MSIFKYLALAALALCLPIAVFANSSVDFGNVGGTLTAVNGGTALSLSGSALTSVNGFGGLGLITGNLGSVAFTTGAISGSLATGGTFGPGGTFVLVSNGSNGLPNGALFSGTFSSATWTAAPVGSKTSFTFTGVISGAFASGYQSSGLTIQVTTISAKNPFRLVAADPLLSAVATPLPQYRSRGA